MFCCRQSASSILSIGPPWEYLSAHYHHSTENEVRWEVSLTIELIVIKRLVSQRWIYIYKTATKIVNFKHSFDSFVCIFEVDLPEFLGINDSNFEY